MELTWFNDEDVSNTKAAVTYRVSDFQVGTLAQTRKRFSILTGSSKSQAEILRMIPHTQLHLWADVLYTNNQNIAVHIHAYKRYTIWMSDAFIQSHMQ